MAESSSKLEEFRAVLRKLVECVETTLIELEGCESLALAKGATHPEIAQAKQTAMADPEIRKQIRENYSGMWEALEKAGTDAFFEDLLQNLPPHGLPS